MTGLPAGWTSVGLGEVCELIPGQSPPGSTYNDRGEGLPFYQGKAEFGALRPTPVKWCSAPVRIAEVDDVLISVRAPVGPTNLCPEQSCIGRGLAAIRPFGGISSRYVLYALRSAESHIARMGTGSTFAAISGEVLRAIEIPLAPFAEQRRIVAAIEEHLSRLDAAVAGLKRVQTQLPRYRAAMLKAAVQVNPSSEIETVSLSSLLREPLRNGHSAKKSDTGTGVRTLTLTAVTAGDFGERNTKLTVADPTRVRDLWLEPGDILVERSNTAALVGSARQYRGPQGFAVFPDLLIRVRVRSERSARFVEIALQALQGRGYFRERASGIAGSMPKIDQDDVASAPIPMFGAEDQRRRVDDYDAAESVADALTHAVERALSKCSLARQSVFRRAFSGKLVPQDPNDEPASVLLERIRTARAAAPIRPGRARRAATR